jgi:hypothetical protein
LIFSTETVFFSIPSDSSFPILLYKMSGEPSQIYKRRRVEETLELPPDNPERPYKPSTSIPQSIFRNENVFDDVCLRICSVLMKHMRKMKPEEQEHLEVKISPVFP